MIGGHGLARYAAATLQAQMPAAIAALNAEPGAPVQLAVPTSYGIHGRHWPLPTLPIDGVVVKVSSPDQDFDNLDIATARADGTGRVQVTVWAQVQISGDPDADLTALNETLHRYAAAVLAVLAHDDSCGPATSTLRASTAVRSADVDPNAPSPPQVAGAAAVVLMVAYDEALSL